MANSGSDTVSVLLGNGDGTFQPASSFDGGNTPIAVAVGDFNHPAKGPPRTSRKLDLAVANFAGNTVGVFLGNGKGNFGPQAEFPVGAAPASVVVGDFNLDGKLDLAVANNDSNTVSVLLGNGDGTFQSAISLPVGNTPRTIAVGDFNGDGKPDLVAADEFSDNVSVLINTTETK